MNLPADFNCFEAFSSFRLQLLSILPVSLSLFSSSFAGLRISAYSACSASVVFIVGSFWSLPLLLLQPLQTQSCFLLPTSMAHWRCGMPHMYVYGLLIVLCWLPVAFSLTAALLHKCDTSKQILYKHTMQCCSFALQEMVMSWHYYALLPAGIDVTLHCKTQLCGFDHFRAPSHWPSLANLSPLHSTHNLGASNNWPKNTS